MKHVLTGKPASDEFDSDPIGAVLKCGQMPDDPGNVVIQSVKAPEPDDTFQVNRVVCENPDAFFTDIQQVAGIGVLGLAEDPEIGDAVTYISRKRLPAYAASFVQGIFQYVRRSLLCYGQRMSFSEQLSHEAFNIDEFKGFLYEKIAALLDFSLFVVIEEHCRHYDERSLR